MTQRKRLEFELTVPVVVVVDVDVPNQTYEVVSVKVAADCELADLADKQLGLDIEEAIS